MLQLANKDGYQIKALTKYPFDFDLNGDMTFELSVPLEQWGKDMDYGSRLFIPNTEIGGIIGTIQTDTTVNTVTVGGYVWRGLLSKKVIVPPINADHYTVSGELNSILKSLIEPAFNGLFKVSDVNTGVYITDYNFDRFCTLLDGLKKMLGSVGYKLEIKYDEGEPNGAGWVAVQAVPIFDYSQEIELSSDYRLSFAMESKKNGVNHLVVAGKGELQERTVLHLYVQGNGTIGDTQYYFGADEIVEFYENTSTDTEELETAGREELEKRMSFQSLDMEIDTLPDSVRIGDIVGGRDHITGMVMFKPVENIVVTYDGINMKKDYKLEGAN